MADTVYGLTAAGFVLKPQQQIIVEIQAALQAVFGQNINLGPESNFGQLVGIFSEREALLWELGQAVYSSQYPGGAEGTSVDNILALNSMRRLPATPTKTNQIAVTGANGITLNGLVLFGTAGTVINAGSLINTNQSPPLQFSLDTTVTIGVAADAQQNLFISNIPDSGSYQLSLLDTAGHTLTTPVIPYNALAQNTQLLFSSVPVAGQFKITLSIAGDALETTAVLYTDSAAALQSAITSLTGYISVTVTGDYTSGFNIAWNGTPEPLVTFTQNTLGVTATPVDSIQSAFNTLHDVTAVNYPYTDVTVVTSASGYLITFGNGSVYGSQPGSDSIAQDLIIIVSNTLMSGSSITNLLITTQTEGHPAQAIGSATCTINGPNFVAAGSLNTIGSPVSGWTGVDNQLDCLSGTNVENDTDALIRRTNNLQAQANGPTASIVEKVRALPNVITAIGFENDNDAALQIVTFATVPVTGSYVLVIDGSPTASIPYSDTAAQVQIAIRLLTGFSAVLVSGDTAAGFTIDLNGSLGGQEVTLLQVTNNTTGISITPSFGRPGHSIEIVAEGGNSTSIAQTILSSKPGGIQSYGSTTVQVFDALGFPRNISFSRPTVVPIYVTIVLTTDLGSASPKFSPSSLSTIQQDIVTIGNEVGIGGLIIGFGSNGLIGAFNSVPGITFYTIAFGRSPNPSTDSNIQMQAEEVPLFESFNVAISYT